MDAVVASTGPASSADDCVVVRNVSKKFARSLKHSFVYGARDIARLLLRRGGDDTLRESEFWAVRDVSFAVPRGKAIGIVGLNGSGKTTLLRMIAGVLRPTLGSIAVHGRIAPMLALGAGFKPVLSGRENVFLNLALLGVAERDIRARFDAIVDFAELRDALDAPLGTYSSGMQARLGFACAVHTAPAILIVDEVLAVGDQRFRVKCRNKINELRRNGTSLLLVSHSAVLVETLADQCLYLRGGRTAMLGAPREVLKAYEDDGVQQAVAGNAQRLVTRIERAIAPDQVLAIRGVTLRSVGGEDGHWTCGSDAELVVDLRSTTALDAISVNLMVFDLTHQPGETVQFMMSCRDVGWLQLASGDAQVVLSLPKLGLRPGTYRVKISVSRGAKHDILDAVGDVRAVVRDAGAAANCLYFQSRDWRFDGAEVGDAPVTDEADASMAEEG